HEGGLKPITALSCVSWLYHPFVYFHAAASSPSSRKVRHLADPPDLTNSPSGVAMGLYPRDCNSRCSSGQPAFVTTVRPTTTALQAKFQASDSATGINSSTTSRKARL